MKLSLMLFQQFVFPCFFFFAFTSYSHAQVLSIDSLYRYNYDDQDEGYNIFLVNDTSYYVLGIGNGYNSQAYGRAFTLHISSNGTLMNETSFFDTSAIANVTIGRRGAVKQLTGSDAHGYLVPVTKSFMNVDSVRGPYNVVAGLMLLDYKGDTVFSKTYPRPHSSLLDVAMACDSLPDGGYIIAGTRTDTAKSNKQYGMVMRTDNAGNLLWTKTYETGLGSQNYLTSIQYIGNGQILLGGGYEFLYYPGGYLVTTDLVPWFLLMDTTGKVIKSISSDYVHSDNHAGGANIFKDQNGGFFYFGNFDYAKDRHDYDDDPLNNIPYIAHLDDSFAQNWITSLCDSVTFYNIWGAKQLKNGSYLMYGSAEQSKRPYWVGWAAKISKSGVLLWHHTYNFEGFASIYSRCEISDVAEHKDGSLTFVGDADDTSITRPNIYTATWLFTVDSNGVGNTMYTALPLLHSPVSDMQVYPNPSSGNFIISVAVPGTVVVYGLSGTELIRTNIVAGKTNIKLPDNLAAGNYLLRFIDNKEHVSDTKNISIVR